MTPKSVAIANDHAALDLKNALVGYLASAGYVLLDLGTNSSDSVDYPDYARKMADSLAAGTADVGILLCGSGIGISMAANRYRHVRAALVHDALGARLARQHNDANVIVLGGRTTGVETAIDCLNVFMRTAFEGGRHCARIEKIS
ncbi:ribose 5-phosphate isomerase B [Haematospirillum jordaniae]|uniref:Ribose-5-phosphate isomerase n=2 Tax=Haematospirillum jordaniae TaxID=1549855 RepID=A0A143DHH2_9PROT|nr:ribose 5-phosphate isomerase B [Haematospirillum jordaniae]AMW35648.1 ribose-5-phosphate isomerase [Haematospirillum jordaniae]NKD46086.1 ribose 5-phosphate isomerase B [Haematospirillum jordaniae]NKD56464.1 ribose 5-phosphate isomerase B [Haematospirillum jordaniae]NKD58522.1 ribose 5-phosphate isomerase B [Haematospirillum jordaniae]NKD66309.1 ribose 5-phosphate isomerase B [Haematospirillum jordaniae]